MGSQDDFDEIRAALFKRLYAIHGVEKSSDLARALGLSRPTLHRLEKSGSGGHAESFANLLQAAGLNLADLLESGQPATPDLDKAVSAQQTGRPPRRPIMQTKTSEVLIFEGLIAAGSGEITLDHHADPERVYPSLMRAIKEKKADLWKLGHGEARIFNVEGDSMAPRYPDGSIAIARLLTDLKSLAKRDRTTCAIRVKRTGHLQFKELIVDADSGGVRRILALPLNHDHKTQRFHPKDVDVTHIIMAAVVF